MSEQKSVRLFKRWPQFGVMAMLIAFTWIASAPSIEPACALAVTDLENFCYRTPIQVTKSNAGNLTNYPVAARISGTQMVSSQVISPYAFDVLSVNSSGTEISATIQDITTGATSPSTWWITADVTGNATTEYQLYTGKADQYNNRSVYFSPQCANGVDDGTCNDSVTVSDASGLDITNNLSVQAWINGTADQDGVIVSKLNGVDGYKYYLSSTSTGYLIAEIGDGSATTTLAAAYDGTQKNTRMTFASGTLNIDFQDSTGTWVNQATKATGFSAIGTNSTNLTIGTGLDADVLEIVISTGYDTASWLPQLDLGFNGVDMAETQRGTSANSWVYQGTVADLTGNHSPTYEFIRPQTDFTTVVLPTVFSTADVTTQAEDAVRNIIGDLGEGNFAETTTAAYRNLGLFGDILDQAAKGTSVTTNSFMFMMLMLLSLGLGIFVYNRTDQNETVFAVIVIVIFGIGAGLGMIPRWWAIIPGIIALTGWLVLARARA